MNLIKSSKSVNKSENSNSSDIYGVLSYEE